MRRSNSDLPKGEAETTTVIIDENGKIIEETANDQKPNANTGNIMEIMKTDGVRHSVPLEEIKGGGPAKDGIPSIDNPKFTGVTEADFLNDDDPGIAVSLNGVDRFYPFQILVWHEIVNDEYPLKEGRGQQRVLVTYCPLCFSGIVFNPKVKGDSVEFGSSGKVILFLVSGLPGWRRIPIRSYINRKDNER